VVAVASTTDGVLDVPADINAAGWWRGGSRIGDPFGSTLLAAHVDSLTQGLGPYVELLSVQSGDRIVVRTAKLRQVFRVRSLRVVDRESLIEATWIYSPRGARRLTLVTCAGPYVRSAGGYQNLAVVTALPTSPPVRLRG
jgi:sortase (surface protein transpeptidase)